MPFYEITYEDGSSGVAYYEDDAEAARALTEAHRRATQGEPANADTRQPASRVRGVFVYEEHPNEFNAEQVTTATEARKAMEGAFTKDKESVHVLAAAIRDISNPYKVTPNAFETRFKMKEDRALKPSVWGGE